MKARETSRHRRHSATITGTGQSEIFFLQFRLQFFRRRVVISVTSFYVVFIFSSKFMLIFLQWLCSLFTGTFSRPCCRNAPLILQFYNFVCFFAVFYFYCPCRKTDDDDDDDDKYGVRSTSTRDSIQYAVTVWHKRLWHHWVAYVV